MMTRWSSLTALVTLVALALPAAAQPKPPPPPSTGKEAPHAAGPLKLTPAEAQQLADRAVAEYGKPQHDCNKIVAAIQTVFANGVDLELTEATAPLYRALAMCAAATGRWTMVQLVVPQLMKVDPRFDEPGLWPSALLALGRTDDALAVANKLLTGRPDDAELRLVQAGAACRLEKWSDCETGAAALQAMLAKAKASPTTATIARVDHVLLGEAYFHQGKFDESTRELALVQPASEVIEKRLKRNEIVKSSKLAVEPDFAKQVALGTYHLLGLVKDVRPLVTLKLYDFDAADRQVRVEIEVPGVTEKVSKTKLLLKGRRELVGITPPLKSDFNLASLRAERPAQLAIKVTALDAGGERVLYEKSYPVTLLPRDMLPLSQQIADESRPTPGFIAAWVTPNARAVDQFLQQAKKRVSDGPLSGAFTGEQHATLPQMRAIWDELQAEGVSYVSDPEVLSDFGHLQRTRLPAEVLESKNAQCLEGTILFATLMEAIGLHPVIVRVPGHAFVGWHASPADGKGPKAVFFVETTAVHNTKFEDAMAFSLHMVLDEEKAGHFNQGIFGKSFMLELSDLRRAGFNPQPND